jgi:hypothetical protein
MFTFQPIFWPNMVIIQAVTNQASTSGYIFAGYSDFSQKRNIKSPSLIHTTPICAVSQSAANGDLYSLDLSNVHVISFALDTAHPTAGHFFSTATVISCQIFPHSKVFFA